MRPSRTLLPLAVLLAMAALLAACGDSGGAEEAGEAAGGGETTAAQEAERTEEGAPAGASAEECEPVAEHEVADLRATGVGCDEASAIATEWAGEGSCHPPSGASRGSCRVREMRCLSAATDRGLAVSCARPGRSVAFVIGQG